MHKDVSEIHGRLRQAELESHHPHACSRPSSNSCQLFLFGSARCRTLSAYTTFHTYSWVYHGADFHGNFLPKRITTQHDKSDYRNKPNFTLICDNDI